MTGLESTKLPEPSVEPFWSPSGANARSAKSSNLKIPWLDVDSPRPIWAAPLSGCSACGCFNLVCVLGASGAILERDEAGVENFGVDQLQVDVGESGEDRLPSCAAEYQREHG
jgi:hypothetical protein